MQDYPAESTARWVLTPSRRTAEGPNRSSGFHQAFDLIAMGVVLLMLLGLVITLHGRSPHGSSRWHTAHRPRGGGLGHRPHHAGWST